MLKNVWQSIKAEFQHQPLGSVYYLFATIGFLAVGLGTGLQYSADFEFRRELKISLMLLAWFVINAAALII